MKLLVLFILFFAFTSSGYCQSEDTTKSKCDYSISADLVSRYVWRGGDFGNSPAIQPTLQASCGKFSIGTWGSTSITSFNLQEADLFASFEIWKLKFSCWDYFYMKMDSSTIRNSYFNYSNKETSHDFSFDTEFTWSEDFPLKILASYNFYGADTLHSSYFEVSYTCQKKVPVEFFAGFTPDKGWYGNGPDFVNIGISIKKEYEISDKYSIPVYCKLIVNPQKENIFLVAGITF